jgi:multidrug efflux pump subunit AcrA (membrane-fusion protein)
LSSPELDIETQRVQGEYDTTRKRLSAVESSLLEAGAGRERDSNRTAQFAAEQDELKSLLKSQRSQLALLAKEREKLLVRSPIDGAVLTWDIEQLLKDRPVERGQSLLGIGDLSGEWVAEIDVPDDQVGYLLDARSARKNSLPVSLQLATDRRREFPGTVRYIAARTELNEDHRPVAQTLVEFDKSMVRELRPGATVFVRIHCGVKPMGYVWFHRLIETIRGWAFYWTG